MARPRSVQKDAIPDLKWKHLIIDGYIDEPASLGVPPFISPYVRSLAGGLVTGGAVEDQIGYMTVDQWRQLRGRNWDIDELDRLESLILVSGCIVPGKYLGGTPISGREVLELFSVSKAPLDVITGAASKDGIPSRAEIHSGDPGVLGEGIASQGRIISKDRTKIQWQDHLVAGAFIVEQHPDLPSPLICEIETSRGCPRFVSGGCSFCMEPGKGPVQFRIPEEIQKEVEALSSHGVENIRIGGQSDLVSYMSNDVGRYEVPEPDPEPVTELMNMAKNALQNGKGVERARNSGKRIGIDTGIVHTDNANPAVISSYPERSSQVLKGIVEGSTPGSVLALGLESSDPEVKTRNNLNSTGDQTIKAIEIMNKVGRQYGDNGMPHLLPGINFLGGLLGQTSDSYTLDLNLLEKVFTLGFFLRRINIRKAIFNNPEEQKDGPHHSAQDEHFNDFKKKVREKYDPRFLERILPIGHVIRGIFVEARSGNVNFGRQIGSYPILVGIPHSVEQGESIDVAISEISARSVTGFRTPFDLRKASFKDLVAIPGIGKKRAATLFTTMGRGGKVEKGLFKDREWVLDHLTD